MTVMELEPVPLGATPPLHVDETAARAVALDDGTAHCGRDVA
jgi:hypothetical protein